MSLRNTAVRVDASRRHSKLVAGPTSSPDGGLSSCSVRSWNDGRPRVVPWAHLCLSIWFRAPIRNLCLRFCATWSRALSFPHTRKVPRYPLLSLRTLAKCVEAIYSHFNDKLICLAKSDLSRSSMKNRHMSALLPEPPPVMTW